MICFQNCIFVPKETAYFSISSVIFKLWFAFKIVFLCRKKQPDVVYPSYIKSCDLLSKLYFCAERNSLYNYFFKLLWVVICFQNCIFVPKETANFSKGNQGLQLWFAFKIVFLCRKKQLKLEIETLLKSCDLLSKLYFCAERNSKRRWLRSSWWVVICFQNCIFVPKETAGTDRVIRGFQLWFAFKIVFLCRKKQRSRY